MTLASLYVLVGSVVGTVTDNSGLGTVAGAKMKTGKERGLNCRKALSELFLVFFDNGFCTLTLSLADSHSVTAVSAGYLSILCQPALC